MPQYLGSNGPAGCDFEGNVHHLKWRPVLVVNQVLDKPWRCLVVALVAWVGHPCNVNDQVFGADQAINIKGG
jgi:hypothetical protein